MQSLKSASNISHPFCYRNIQGKYYKEKLENLLPYELGVGTGFVIDSYDKVSTQSDIIIDEKELCTRFVIGETEDELVKYKEVGTYLLQNIKNNH